MDIPPRPRRWLTPACIALGVPVGVVSGVVAATGSGESVGLLLVGAFVGVSLVVFPWSDHFAPRKEMRRVADLLGWRPTTTKGFQHAALRGDRRLTPAADAGAYDLIEGTDGSQAFRIAGEGGQWVVAVRPIERSCPYLATTAKPRRVASVPAPRVGRSVALGDHAFDTRFHTMTEAPELAHSVLTPSVRAVIAAHPGYCLRIDGDRAVAFRSSLPSAEVVTGLLEFLDRVVAAVPEHAWLDTSR